jgi:Cu/Ag efflux pump CusA
MPANLLSLGAMDFGIIVDGAVIVIENILHRLPSCCPIRTDRKAQAANTVLTRPRPRSGGRPCSRC